MMLDDRLNFHSHVDYVCMKATESIVALSRSIRNYSAISSSKKRLLADVNVDNIVGRMCSNKDEWNAVNTTVIQILSALQWSRREVQRHVLYRFREIFLCNM